MCTISLASRIPCILPVHARGVIFPESVSDNANNKREQGRLKIFARTFTRGSAAISARYLAFPQTRQVCETADVSLSPSPSLSPLYSLPYFTSVICNVSDFNTPADSPEFRYRITFSRLTMIIV